MAMHAEVAVLGNQLAAMKCRCQESVVAMETHLLMRKNKDAKDQIEAATLAKTKRYLIKNTRAVLGTLFNTLK